LYEIQKIEDKKEQVSVYFDFVAKKLDRKALRERNKTKVSLAKQRKLFTFIKSTKKVKLEIDISKFTEKDKDKINKELEVILERYGFHQK